ncbi:MAG: phenylacetate-CoA oxygenase subunit PaaJ [Saprospiraceae bacterium]|nr:phenylacetate-CoA oxygenase subunit PaaJ [Saprospiraceae bacterium]
MKEKVYKILENVTDPEIPVLTIQDLGIVRDVRIEGEEAIEIVITPTYSGCPAMSVIAAHIKMELMANGFKNVKVTEVFSPAWTTDWLSESGKKKLKEYGIAPPVAQARLEKLLFQVPPSVNCPRCGSDKTNLISEFGSTSCKSLMRCDDCLEPFDYFKCH